MKKSNTGNTRKKAKTPVTIMLSDEAVAWLEKKAGDEMRTRASYGAKIIEMLSQGMYISNESPDERTKKSRRILKSKEIHRKRLITISLSRNALIWLEKGAAQDVRSRATFAAKIIEQLARGMYIPTLSGVGEDNGKCIKFERKVGVIATDNPRPPVDPNSAAGIFMQKFMEFARDFPYGPVSTSNRSWSEEINEEMDKKKERKNGKTNRPKN